MESYNFLRQRFDNNRSLSITSALKPLSIGSVSNIVSNDILLLRNKINSQLTRLNNLQKKTTYQINNPKYIKTQQKNKIDLKFLNQAISIHKKYYSDLLYQKNKFKNLDVNFVQQLSKVYSNKLFLLNQQYQKTKLEFKGIDTNENLPRNPIQFSQI